MRKTLPCLMIILSCGSALAGSIRDHRLYTRIVELRDADPDRFDGRYPFIGRIVSDDQFFQRYYDRWQGHPERFEYWHPLLTRILESRPDFPPSPPPPPPNGHLPDPPPFIPPDDCGPNPPPPPGVPEPKTIWMIQVGLASILLARRLWK